MEMNLENLKECLVDSFGWLSDDYHCSLNFDSPRSDVVSGGCTDFYSASFKNEFSVLIVKINTFRGIPSIVLRARGMYAHLGGEYAASYNLNLLIDRYCPDRSPFSRYQDLNLSLSLDDLRSVLTDCSKILKEYATAVFEGKWGLYVELYDFLNKRRGRDGGEE